MDQPTDEQIRIWTARIAESDRDAFEQFFRRFYPRLVQFACRYTASKPAASDIVQDAFVILWEKRREVNPNKSLKAFVYRIVRNRALNYLRDHADRIVPLETLNTMPASMQEDTEISTEKNQSIHDLKTWIEALPKRRREAFKLSRFEGLDHREIARVMDISTHTVNNHMVAALQFLRDRYEQKSKKEDI